MISRTRHCVLCNGKQLPAIKNYDRLKTLICPHQNRLKTLISPHQNRLRKAEYEKLIQILDAELSVFTNFCKSVQAK